MIINHRDPFRFRSSSGSGNELVFGANTNLGIRAVGILQAAPIPIWYLRWISALGGFSGADTNLVFALELWSGGFSGADTNLVIRAGALVLEGFRAPIPIWYSRLFQGERGHVLRGPGWDGLGLRLRRPGRVR